MGCEKGDGPGLPAWKRVLWLKRAGEALAGWSGLVQSEKGQETGILPR